MDHGYVPAPLTQKQWEGNPDKHRAPFLLFTGDMVTLKTSKGEGMKRFMVVRAYEKYMGSFYETLEEAEKAALEESNGDPGGDFHIMEIICAVSRPPHPNAVLTRFVPLSVEQALEKNLNIAKKGRQQQKAESFGRVYGMSEEKIAASHKPMDQGPRNFFLNQAHELPPIKKSELRKQNKMLRDAKKEGKKWCSICLTGPCGLWEHAEKGSAFCRRHK